MGLPEMTGDVHVVINLGGKDYKVRPLDLGDQSDFMLLLQNDQRKDAEAVLTTLKKAGIGDEIAVREWRVKYNRADNIGAISVGLNLLTLRGVRYSFYRGARKDHPDLTEEQVEKLIVEDNRSDLIRQMEPLHPKPEKKDIKAAGADAPSGK